jgi:hypothetical protein
MPAHDHDVPPVTNTSSPANGFNLDLRLRASATIPARSIFIPPSNGQ